MKVVVVGKTRMYNDQWCIGGLRLRDWASVRLLPPGLGRAWPTDTPLNVGSVVEVEGARPAQVVLPHTEDFRISHLVHLGRYTGDLPADICRNVQVARKGGVPVFEDCLCRIPPRSLAIRHGKVPNFSTQFWIAHRPLIHEVARERDYFRIGGARVIYVGAQEPVAVVAAGSLVRLSLARWWAPGDQEEACFLQVSGWWPPPASGSW